MPWSNLTPLAAVLLLFALPTSVAHAEVGHAPTATRVGLAADALHVHDNAIGPDEVRLIASPDTAGGVGLLCFLPPALDDEDCRALPTESSIALMGVASAASWGDDSLVADPVSGSLWKVGTNIQGDVTVDLLTDMGVDPDTGVAVPLCSPVALVHRNNLIGGGRSAFFAEGSAGGGPPWTDFATDCPDAPGGVQYRGLWGATTTSIPAGLGAGEVPLAPVKGLALAWSGEEEFLYAVVGDPADGWNEGTARLVATWVTDDAAQSVSNWAIDPEFTTEGKALSVGQPHLVAGLTGERLAIGGPDGLLVFDLEGNLLDVVWIAGADSPDPVLDQAIELIDMAATPDGSLLYGLLARGGDQIVVRWAATDFASAGSASICAGHDYGTGCVSLSGPNEHGCTIECSRIQQAIEHAGTGDKVLVLPGSYHEALKVRAKAVTIKAVEPGTVRILPPDGPALFVQYNGPPGVVVEGIVLQGGNGVEFDGESAGGVVAVFEGAVELRRSVLAFGQATAGGGLAAVAARSVHLENVGIFGNEADFGAGLWIYGEGLHPQTPTELRYVTVTDNVAHVSGGAACVDGTVMGVNSVILAANGDEALCGWPGEGDGGVDIFIEYSDLWPADAWTVFPHLGEPFDLDAAGELGEGNILDDPRFADPSRHDYHLDDGSAAQDAGDPGENDHDDSRSDMGMFAGEDGDWDFELEPDDDDVGPDDDDVTPDDDDATPDDDDVVSDDDDSGAGDDDDGVLLPSGLRCDCAMGATDGGAGLAWSLLALGLIALRRRR
jgi:MYXO-CTERM domain-containing protein